MYDANVSMTQIEEDVRFSYNDKDENIINSQRNDWDNKFASINYQLLLYDQPGV